MLRIFNKYSKRQLQTMFVLGVADVCSAMCDSLQAPLYPAEAESKGATPIEYGLVFAVFQLTVLIISPIYGQKVNQIGSKNLLSSGLLTAGACTFLFGCLDYIEGHLFFIILSFVIRILEALGHAAYLISSFSISTKEFPEETATIFATLEAFDGVGQVISPILGGALFQIGGYMTPFVTLGSILFLSGVITDFLLPEQSEVVAFHKSSLLQVLHIPDVFLAACSITLASFSMGFLNTALEPHLRQFGFSPVVLGAMFAIRSVSYAITTPCCGLVCDRWVSPKIVILLGAIFFIISFTLIGPAPFVHSPTILGFTILALIINGLGIGASFVAGFVHALQTVIKHGYPDNAETYGLISGLWASSYALGGCFGPTVAGFLNHAAGFRRASMCVVAVSFIFFVCAAIYMCHTKRRQNTYEQIGR